MKIDYDKNSQFWKRTSPIIQSDFICRPAVIKILGDVGGKNILDAGCGEGYVSRLLFARKAKVVGIDISSKMIRLAREQSKDIAYQVGGITHLRNIKSKSQDIYLSVLAYNCLNKDSDYYSALKSANRVTKRGGLLVIAIPHPFEAVCHYSSKWISFLSKEQSYWKKHLVLKKMYDIYRNFFIVKNVHRPLGQFITDIIEAGFVIEKIVEPQLHPKDSKKYSAMWGEEKYKPSYLIVKARKSTN